MKAAITYIIVLFSIIAVTSSCRKESFTIDSNDNIELSTDTLWYDTVFTKVNASTPLSVNKQVIVKNPHNESIRTNIQLAGGAMSHFRLNVDGEPGHNFTDVEIFPNDSIFLFVEVHPDENNNSPLFNPLIITDSILFNTNGNESKVNLIGWGQDAHYIFRDSIETDTTWADTSLPIVVYGYCYVKPNVTLTIEKGMQVHYAPSSWLFVEGKIDVNGTKEQPVLMQGDRLQPDWEETAGQWGGIWINYPSHSSTIDYALIKNGTVGVYCDTITGQAGQPNVTINKTHIRNMRFDGVAGRYSTIVMQNSVSTNCGRFTFLASFGGNYDVRHCTFYTGERDFARSEPTFAFLNIERDQFGGIVNTFDMQYNFTNNIFWGLLDNEIGNDLDAAKVSPTSLVDYNLIKTNSIAYSQAGSSNITNKEPKFIDAFNYNLDLDSLSAAKDFGWNLQSFSDDICDRPRDASPDMGAYESQF